jgi:hypothetical protein
VEDLGIEAHRETERDRETHTHTHNFSEGKKRNKRDEDLQKGPEFGCVFCKDLKKDNNELQHCVCEKNTCEEFSGGQQEISLWFFASRKMSGRRTLYSRQAL